MVVKYLMHLVLSSFTIISHSLAKDLTLKLTLIIANAKLFWGNAKVLKVTQKYLQKSPPHRDPKPKMTKSTGNFYKIKKRKDKKVKCNWPFSNLFIFTFGTKIISNYLSSL